MLKPIELSIAPIPEPLGVKKETSIFSQETPTTSAFDPDLPQKRFQATLKPIQTKLFRVSLSIAA